MLKGHQVSDHELFTTCEPRIPFTILTRLILSKVVIVSRVSFCLLVSRTLWVGMGMGWDRLMTGSRCGTSVRFMFDTYVAAVLFTV